MLKFCRKSFIYPSHIHISCRLRTSISVPVSTRFKGSVCRFIFHKIPFVACYGSIFVPNMSKDYSINPEVAQKNYAITKLSREGRLQEAREVFDEMPHRDVLTWSTLISGYIKSGSIRQARELFDRVDSLKNVVTWTAMVGGYIRTNQLSEAERLFDAMPEKNVVSRNTMMDGYARAGQIEMALELFELMPERNVVSWNTVVAALAQSGRIGEAKSLFDRMPEKDVVSWTTMVAGLSRNGRIDEARQVFNSTPQRSVVSWNAMLAGYAQNHRLDEAYDLFVVMPERNTSSWNAMITGFTQNGDLERAKMLFGQMPDRNVVSWTAMISGCAQEGQNELALKIFREMLQEADSNKIKPNQGTFVSVLGACCNIGGLCEGKQIHQIISKTSYLYNTSVISALINMYSKCGELRTARQLFDASPSTHRDLISWNGLISAYAHHGSGVEAIRLFDEMRGTAAGFKPDDVTYVGLLSACSHSGLVAKGLQYFEDLVNDPSIQVREDHFACLVDLCGRAGRLDEAIKFIHRLGEKRKPVACLWGALLAGCNLHRGNEDIAKLAARKLMEVEPENAGTYMLLHNIYASSGKWKEAAQVRLKMKDEGLKKQPGCSWIEIGNRFHVFVVRDKSHSESKVIDSVVRNLHGVMRKDRFVPTEGLLDYEIAVN